MHALFSFVTCAPILTKIHSSVFFISIKFQACKEDSTFFHIVTFTTDLENPLGAYSLYGWRNASSLVMMPLVIFTRSCMEAQTMQLTEADMVIDVIKFVQ